MANSDSWRKTIPEILSLAYPIIVGAASVTVMHFVDTWMVARVGESDLAAIASAGLLIFCFLSFLVGVLSCTNTFVGQSYGRELLPDCSRYTWQAIYLGVTAGAFGFLLWPLAPAIFTRIGHELAIREREIIYFRWRIPSIWSLAGTVALSSFFQATGRPRIPMFAALGANAINILLNYALIFGRLGCPRLGIQGAAIATSIGAALQVITLFVLFLSRGENAAYRSREVGQLDLHRLRELIRVGWPAGVTFFLDVASWTVFVALVVGSFGRVALAANTVAVTLIHLSFMPAVGLSIALTTLVGRYIGRKDFKAVRERVVISLVLGLAYMGLMGLGFFLFRRPLVRLFVLESEVVELGSRFLILAAVFQVFDGLCIISRGALKGAGDTRWPALITAIYGWLLFLPASYVLGRLLGPVGTWLAASFYVAALGLTLFGRFQSGRWQDISIFLPELPVPARIPEEARTP